MRTLLIATIIACLPGLAAAAACPEPMENGAKLAFTGTRLAQPHYTTVIAGGRLSLAACGMVPGEGHVTPTPDFNVMLADMGGRAVEFRTAGDCDTVLVVADARGVWHFDDDGAGGEDARVRIDAAPDGRYNVWIGTFGAASCRARLIVESFR